MKKQPSEVYDPYLGTVFGNIMDEYDSTAYQLRLYMINKNAVAGNNSAIDPTLIDVEDKQNTVIIADTGSTSGNQIDNLSLSLVGAKAIGNKATFEIFQPGRADLLDQIQAAKYVLGYRGAELAMPPTFILEINFHGRTSNITDNEDEGEISQIRGPYRYELFVENITATVNETGATFAFSAVPKQALGYREEYYRLPKDFFLEGQSITDLLGDLVVKLNEFIEQNTSRYKFGDEYDLDLTEVLEFPGFWTGTTTASTLRRDGAPPLISDESIKLSEKPGSETISRTMEKSSTEQTTVYHVRRGETIKDVVIRILSMNSEFKRMITRTKQNLSSPKELTEDIKNNPYITWVDINLIFTEDTAKYDDARQCFQRTIIIKPVLYYSPRTDVFIDPAENKDLSVENIRNRISTYRDSMGCVKSYYYIFTGRNDQVIDLDITMNMAHAVLMAPGDGKIGSITAVAGTLASADAVDPVINESQQNYNNFYDNRNFALGELSSVFSQDSINSGRTDAIEQFFVDNGFYTQTEVNDLLQTAQGQEELVNSLSPDELAAFKNAQYTNTSTQSPGQADAIYRYTEDFYVANQGGQSPSDVIQILDLNDVKTGFYEGIIQTRFNETNVVESAGKDLTEDEKAENMLLGTLISQHAEKMFLTKVDMTIRGDPWYLGEEAVPTFQNNIIGNSTNNHIVHWGDENMFLLEIASPPPTDIDDSDEDNNTGYWSNKVVQNTFTGIYMLKQTTHNFGSGKYTINLEGVRLSHLDIAKLDPLPLNIINTP